jgi:hypothetical protein
MNWFASYKKVQPAILNLILAEVCIQLINAAFMFILLIYMQKQGYTDYEGANFTKFRFLSVITLSIPIGMWIEGRRIKPFFYAACVIVPVMSVCTIYGIEIKSDWIIYVSQFIWGLGFIFIQVTALPFILRNASSDTVTEGISLSHSTWSIAGILSGSFIFLFRSIDPEIFSERNLLIALSIAGFSGLYFVSRIRIEEQVNDPARKSKTREAYNWRLILEASIPITLIAVGAGLTIPFISVFFYNVHGIDSETFSIMGALALIIVFWGTMLVPVIKNRMGYKTAVPLTQSLAILSLIFLALTELGAGTTSGLVLAIFFYTLRQPLMNMAAPMTSEVTMMYVGERNREMMSALTASIWSGSWFISAWIFEILREDRVRYMNIFFITAMLYSLGVVAYMLLIRKHEKKNSAVEKSE